MEFQRKATLYPLYPLYLPSIAIPKQLLSALQRARKRKNRMNSFTASQKSVKRHNLIMALIAILVGILIVVPPLPVQAAQIPVPAVPDAIKVPVGNEPYQIGHAVGTQNYICLPTDTGVAYKLFTPQATLFDDSGKQFVTHFFSPNPAENGTIRATWEDSKDSSMIWGEVKPGNSSTDANYVAPGAIAWLLVTQVGTQAGPDGGDTLMKTTFIQRVNTIGGIAPADCNTTANVGKQAFVPYTTDYIFYRAAK
jgi:hypothetical protein